MNGVPLRRVNQAYVIATSKTVDVSGVKLPDNVNDAFFTAGPEGKDKKEYVFGGEKPKVCDHALCCCRLCLHALTVFVSCLF